MDQVSWRPHISAHANSKPHAGGYSGGGGWVAPPGARGRIRPIKCLFKSPTNVCGVYQAQQTWGQRNAGRTHCLRRGSWSRLST